MHVSDVKLRSPKLPLLDTRQSLQAFVAHISESSASRSSASCCRDAACFGTAPVQFMLPSVVERMTGDMIYLEKHLFDSFSFQNVLVSTVVAGLSSTLQEVQRAGVIEYWLDETDEIAEAKPDWVKVAQDGALGFTREVGGNTTQRAFEKLLKARVSPHRFREVIKHVGKQAQFVYQQQCGTMSGFKARAAAARSVLMSWAPYSNRYCAICLFDVQLDVLRMTFPHQWRLRLSPLSFRRNAWLKFVKYFLCGVLSLSFGCLMPFLVVRPLAFLGVDLLANTVADMLVASLGTIE